MASSTQDRSHVWKPHHDLMGTRRKSPCLPKSYRNQHSSFHRQICSHLGEPGWKARIKTHGEGALSGFQICSHLDEPGWKAYQPTPTRIPTFSKSARDHLQAVSGITRDEVPFEFLACPSRTRFLQSVGECNASSLREYWPHRRGPGRFLAKVQSTNEPCRHQWH